MNAWNSYSAAKIKYVYAGAGSGAPGGLSAPNGVNEVLFNDPKGEISGTFNPAACTLAPAPAASPPGPP